MGRDNEPGLRGEPEAMKVLEPYLHARHYKAGQVLWTEGEVSGRMVLLVQGRVKAVRVLPDGSSVLLHVFSAGDIFGFLPLVDGGPYPATAIAVDEVDARVMSRSELRQAVHQDPPVAMVLLKALGKRLRQAFGRLGDQAQRSSLARVAAALSLLLPEAGGSDVTTIIDVPSPIHDFAADVPREGNTGVARAAGGRRAAHRAGDGSSRREDPQDRRHRESGPAQAAGSVRLLRLRAVRRHGRREVRSGRR